jgi:hypothetical protein
VKTSFKCVSRKPFAEKWIAKIHPMGFVFFFGVVVVFVVFFFLEGLPR